MAIDSANKRRNVLNIATGFLYLGLLPTAGIDSSDRENLSEAYIGFTYSPPPVVLFAGISPIVVHIGVGF